MSATIAAPHAGPAATRPDLARDALLIEIENYSENHYCAGWYGGIEFILWKRILDLPVSDSAEAYTSRLLAETAQGWWHWDRTSAKPVFVSMDDWLNIYAEHKKLCIRD